jgi:hypothetical protein
MKTTKQGICQLALIPLRSEPSERSELVNQILFGETFSILETKENWSFIETHFDNYKGWITSKMATIFTYIPENILHPIYLKDEIGRISFPGNPIQFLWIPGGATLHKSGLEFTNFNESFTFDPVCQVHTSEAIQNLTETALKYLNAPYLWGGRTIFGIDCSGFTQIIHKMNGVNILRDASQQSEQGTLINSIEDAKPGDLAFFDNPEGRIIHVGMIIEKGKIIHASGKVRIDKIDQQGIYNEDFQKYTHKLRHIKRMIN